MRSENRYSYVRKTDAADASYQMPSHYASSEVRLSEYFIREGLHEPRLVEVEVATDYSGLHEFNFKFDNGRQTEWLKLGKRDSNVRLCWHKLGLNEVFSFKTKLVLTKNSSWPWHTTDLEINGIPICDPKLSKSTGLKKELTEALESNEFITGFKHVFNSQNG